MKISKSHQRFADRLENQRAIEHPQEFLGPNWKDVLNFWLFLDTLTEEQWQIINDQYNSLTGDVKCDAYQAARVAAIEATNQYVSDVIFFVDNYYFSSIDATRELMGSHILKEQGKSLVFFPMFLNV